MQILKFNVANAGIIHVFVGCLNMLHNTTDRLQSLIAIIGLNSITVVVCTRPIAISSNPNCDQVILFPEGDNPVRVWLLHEI